MAVMSAICTSRLRIVPFAERHLTERCVGWLNDPEVVRYSEQRHRRHDLESCKDYFESIARSPGFFSAIEERAQDRHIGNISIAVDPANDIADISILLGDRTTWGSGFGFEAWKAVLDTLLGCERFRKVTGGAMASNRAMIRIMEKADMRLDGRRTAHYLLNGLPVDIVHYASFGKTGDIFADKLEV